VQDKLLMEDGNKWLYKNKEHGMLSATASIGLVLLWDVDGGVKMNNSLFIWFLMTTHYLV
jgi:hypothetical protein